MRGIYYYYFRSNNSKNTVKTFSKQKKTFEIYPVVTSTSVEDNNKIAHLSSECVKDVILLYYRVGIL